MKESLRQGLFQTQIIECKTKPLLGESAHMMIMPLRACEAQSDGAWPLPLGLHVYTRLKMSSSKVCRSKDYVGQSHLSGEMGKGGMLGVSLTSSPRNLLPSTVPNAFAMVNSIRIHIGGCAFSISEKPTSATHFPSSTTST